LFHLHEKQFVYTFVEMQNWMAWVKATQPMEFQKLKYEKEAAAPDPAFHPEAAGSREAKAWAAPGKLHKEQTQ
jgi:hypothetical protein